MRKSILILVLIAMIAVNLSNGWGRWGGRRRSSRGRRRSSRFVGGLIGMAGRLGNYYRKCREYRICKRSHEEPTAMDFKQFQANFHGDGKLPLREQKRDFGAIDRNGDGFVSTEEIRQAAKMMIR